MATLPKDYSARQIASEARKQVHNAFSTEHWEYREETGNDMGRDCIIELVENEQWSNRKIEGQIKGTKEPVFLSDVQSISFPLEVKTINYGLGSSVPFALLYVDVANQVVYYLPIQDYFIENPNLFDKLDSRKTCCVHIPVDNVVCDQDESLRLLAKSTYVGGPGRDLKKVN